MADFKKKKKVNPTKASIATIRGHIKTNSFSRMYLLFGEEKYLVNQYRDELKAALSSPDDTMNMVSYNSDTFDLNTVISDAITIPFFAEHRVIIVEDSGLFDLSEDAFLEVLDQMPDTNVLIFCETKVNKSKKAYLHADKDERVTCAEFDTPTTDDLISWLGMILGEDGLKVKLAVPEMLITAAGPDKNMYLLRNEARKLHDYCLDRGAITEADVEAVCASSVEDKIFDMCRAISQKNRDAAISMYMDLLKLGRTPYNIIGSISYQFNQLLIVSQMLKDKATAKEISSKLKVADWAASRLIKICYSYTHKDLIRSVELCQQATMSLMSSELTSRDVAENLIINLIK